jgi:protease-4
MSERNPPGMPPLPPPRRNGFWAFLRAFGRVVNGVRLVILNVLFFGVLFLLLIFVTAGIIGSSAARTIQNDSVLVLRPEGQLVEQLPDPVKRAISTLSGNQVKQVQVRDLVRAIDSAATDKRITRIVLDPDQLSAGGFAALREVGSALDRFRATGKPVIVWAANLDQGQYYLAAHANRILLDPQGSVLATGLANYRLFYKDLLDKVGVDVHLFRVGQFKSAAEPFILDHASPESKQADAYYLGGLWDTWLDEVAALRKIDPAVLRKQIDDSPQEIANAHGNVAQLALDQHLIDGLATEAELVAELRKEGVPAGKRDEGFRQVQLQRYVASLDTNPLDTSPGIAVVVAEGEIVGGKQPQGSIGGESTAALIRQARTDKKTRALVLRVNSPGGEVYAAEQIRREIALTREAGIPVIVSMGDVAASGGYWISMNANKILAEPNTITGSIGIFGMFYTVPGALDKIGVHSDGVAVGPLAGSFDITRPLDPKVGLVVQSIIDKGYRDFVGGVAAARRKDFAAIDNIAQGRVWTGSQALERGLVDRLGGFHEALAEAASEAKLDKGAPVRYIEPEVSSFGRFLVGMNDSAMVQVGRSWGLGLPAWLASMPERVPELKLLQHAEAGKPHVYAYCFCSPQ